MFDAQLITSSVVSAQPGSSRKDVHMLFPEEEKIIVEETRSNGQTVVEERWEESMLHTHTHHLDSDSGCCGNKESCPTHDMDCCVRCELVLNVSAGVWWTLCTVSRMKCRSWNRWVCFLINTLHLLLLMSPVFMFSDSLLFFPSLFVFLQDNKRMKRTLEEEQRARKELERIVRRVLKNMNDPTWDETNLWDQHVSTHQVLTFKWTNDLWHVVQWTEAANTWSHFSISSLFPVSQTLDQDKTPAGLQQSHPACKAEKPY